MDINTIKTAWKFSKRKKPLTISRVFLGSLLIIIGIPGLVLPFLQGFLLIIIGIFILSNRKWKVLWIYLSKAK